MKIKLKEMYLSPKVEILDFKIEGIVCTSNPEGEGSGYEGWD